MVAIIILLSLRRWVPIPLWIPHLDGVSGERIGLFYAMQPKFSNPHSFPCIDKALEYFLDVVIKASENSIPRVMPSSKPRLPWWNPECREAIRERKKALRRFHRTKCL